MSGLKSVKLIVLILSICFTGQGRVFAASSRSGERAVASGSPGTAGCQVPQEWKVERTKRTNKSFGFSTLEQLDVRGVKKVP